LLFGPFSVLVNGEPLPRLRWRKQEAILALLTLRHDRPVDRAWLAGLLWPDASEGQGLAALRRYLTGLRRALGPEASRLLSPTSATLLFDLAGAAVDVIPFDAALSRWGTAATQLRGMPGEAVVEGLEEAVSLYRGPLLEGWTDEWVFEERQAREEACLQSLEALALHASERGDMGTAERHLRRAVAVDPLRENAQRALMEALSAGGNYTAAAQVYQELRRRLHQELNAQPDPQTQALFQQLRAAARRKSDKVTRWQGDRVTKGTGQPIGVEAARQPPAVTLSRSEASTLTFLLTDVEGSTRLWLQDLEAMRQALARHDALVAAVIQQHHGLLVKQRGEGDSLFAVFARATDAVAAALALQRALAGEVWPAELPLKVRVALHTGEAEVRDGDYYGPVVNHCARLRAVGHGGQTLLSQTTAALVREALPESVSLRELGAHRLKDLQRPEPIFQLVHPDLPAEFPPLRSLEAFAHNLPVQLTRFVGREGEITEVKRLLTTARLLTLTGAGGCGKTRLALQVAVELVEEYADGIWLVELAALSDPSLLAQTVASALGVREEAGRSLTEALTDTLRGRSLLLVFDNCEHLLPACAELADRLLRACPHLRILATSREGLGLLGEQTYRVPPLSVPGPGQLPSLERLQEFEAVGLFVDRAVLWQPTFTLTSTNAPAVVQICQRLDGIPLAIELAAARVKALPVEKLSERLDHRFRLLTGGSRTALPRHQTLQALIDWSYELLTEPERLLLRRLSVFAGTWTLEAAEAVCSDCGLRMTALRAVIRNEDVLDLLTSLVEKSLVGYEAAVEARYRLLETVRQYARDRLLETEEAADMRRRHREWFLGLALAAAPELRGPRQRDWLDRLESEHDNVRLALEWCRTEATGEEAELRLAGALVWFWVKRGHMSEGRQHLERALSRSSGDFPSLRMWALLGAGRLAMLAGDYTASIPFLKAALDLAQATGDPEGMATALSTLTVRAVQANDSEQASALAEESLARAHEAGDPWLIAFCLQCLGGAVRSRGDIEHARTLFADSLGLMRQAGDIWCTSLILLNLGGVAQAEGDNERARRAYQEGLIFSRQLEDRRGMAWCLECLAELAAAQGRPQQGARLLGAAEGLLDAVGGSWAPTYVAGRERAIAVLRAALGEEAFATARAAGRAMPLEQACACALQEDAAPARDAG
jgi:predicted ATPase/DNA-binding SARP family transcriptional activator